MKPFKQTKINYNTYVKSRDWYSKHPDWLKSVGHSCTMFPWIKIGQGHKYACHHMNYENLGNERLRRDVVPLSPFAHKFVIHGILSGFKSAGQQRGYPNLAQRLAHLWCVQRLWFKLILVLLLLWKLSELSLKLK